MVGVPDTEVAVELLANPYRGTGLPPEAGLSRGTVLADPSGVQALLARCPAHAPTPLLDLPAVARAFAVGAVWAKDERGRMGLGSFKALGAAHAIARMAAERVDPPGGEASPEVMATALRDTTFTCASAGNHGLSLAAGARVFGARAVVVLAHPVPESFAERLRAHGARVVRAGDDYEASMVAAERGAREHGWVLLSDSSWPGYTELPTRVMEGYLAMAAEVADTVPEPPTHVVLQAGVGGLAAAVTALLRSRWGDEPTVVVVEPAAAPALQASIRAGQPVVAPGPPSTMGRLDCKEPSHLALGELARSADLFVTLTDAEVAETVDLLAHQGLATTPSGAAGLAAIHGRGHRDALGVDDHSRVLALLTEAAEQDPL